MRSRIVTLVVATTLCVGCGGEGTSSEAVASTPASAATQDPGGALGGFAVGPDLNTPRGQHTATLLPDGRVLVVGGTDGTGVLADSEIYDPKANTWTSVRDLNLDQSVVDPTAGLMMDASGTLAIARQLHSATLLADGRVLIAGGIGIERLDEGVPVMETLSSAHIFDPLTNAFERVGSLTTPRAWHVAAPLGAGAVLAGGLDDTLQSSGTADVFDPETHTFTSVTMNDRHTWGALVSLGNEALVLGGVDLFQTAQGSWAIAALPAVRAEVLASGADAFVEGPAYDVDLVHVGSNTFAGGAYFAGGQAALEQGLTAVASTARYDSATGAFEAGPDLRTARYACRVATAGAATTDQLVIGGLDGQGQQLRSCELWDSAANAFVGAADLITLRSDFCAVTLLDGRILVIGGLDAQTLGIRQTELYQR